jgi:hypothetical protein
MWSCIAMAGATAVAACNSNYGTAPRSQVTLGDPDSLTYVLLPGWPGQPAGVLLTWVGASDPSVTSYVVYGRDAAGGSYGPMGHTGGTTFFDAFPQNQYYVASEDQAGDISRGTQPITVDLTPPLAAPDGLAGVGIDSGAKLAWSTSARLGNPSEFSYYRVYSEPAIVSGTTGAGAVPELPAVGARWVTASCPPAGSGFGLEGTTVSENFVITGIGNGTPMCYGVTTVAAFGQESVLSSWVIVTPSASGGAFDIARNPGVTVVRHRTRARTTR